MNEARNGNARRFTRGYCGGFTLVELLVVVTIIVVLLSILLPATSHAIGLAEDIQCRNNLSQLGKGLISCAADNFQVLPGSTPGYGAPAGAKIWIGSECTYNTTGTLDNSSLGAICDYAGGATAIAPLYRCPSLAVAPLGSGTGSNGMYDYSMSLTWGGASMTTIPSNSSYHVVGPPDFSNSALPTPLISEEDPDHHLNSASIEPGFGSIDLMGSHHQDGSGNYESTDGSGQHMLYMPVTPNARVCPCGRPTQRADVPRNQEWYSRRPSGKEYQHWDVNYGWWNQQP